MRRLSMKMSLSLDGYVADADGGNAWVFRSSDEGSRTWAVNRTQEAGLIIMGRKSFEGMAPYWPTADGPFAAPMNTISKAVFTQKGFKPTKLPDPATPEIARANESWERATVYAGELGEHIRTLKAAPGKPIVAIGGASFMRSLILTGLIDEYHLAIHPVALGKGLAIFSDLPRPLDLHLTEAKAFAGGVVVHTYRNVTFT